MTFLQTQRLCVFFMSFFMATLMFAQIKVTPTGATKIGQLVPAGNSDDGNDVITLGLYGRNTTDQYRPGFRIRTADRNELIKIANGKANRIHVRKNCSSRFSEFQNNAILKLFPFNDIRRLLPILFFLSDIFQQKLFHSSFFTGRTMNFAKLFEEFHRRC